MANQLAEATTTRFCVDCKWMRESESGDVENATCGHENGRRFSQVTGLELRAIFCENQRNSCLPCGPTGKNWEAK